MKLKKSPPAATKGGDLIIPPNERKTLRALKHSDCRWPYGDPSKSDFYYCGKPKWLAIPIANFIRVVPFSLRGRVTPGH